MPFFVLLLLVPCFAIKKRVMDGSEILDYRSTTCIKGGLCLFVMFHNLRLDYNGNTEVMEVIFEHAGDVGVGLFFFLSAFGIIKSYQKHGNKYFWIGFILAVLGFLIGFFTWEIIATYSSALLIIIVSQRITYDNNITLFLGKICIGVYLFLHFSSLALQPYLSNPYWWMLLNAGFILELSVILCGPLFFIQKGFNKITQIVNSKTEKK